MVSRSSLTVIRDLNQAIEDYFSNHAASMEAKKGSSSKADPKKCVELFERFASKGGVMNQDGIEAFFNELGVDAQTDIVAILVAQYCEA